MRISSLARKISKKPSEVISFFEERGDAPDSGAHTKLTDEQVEAALKEFAPDLLDDKSKEHVEAKSDAPLLQEIEEVVEAEVDTPDDSTPETPIEASIDENPVDVDEDIEVIRAPKVTLPGLKVKGKIDLPEPKKPEPKEEKKDQREKELGKKVGNGRNKKRNDNYNPVAAARKRQQEKEESERKEALKRKKNAKAKHYYKMQQKIAKEKRENENDAGVEESSQIQERQETKKNAFQRFWKWFNT